MRKEKIRTFFNNKYVAPVKKLLLQGTTPREIALGVAVSFVLGLFPVLGSTTLLTTGFALLFRLNLPLVQLINFTVYPLQIIMLVPFMKLGELIFRFESVNYGLSEITNMLAESIPDTISLLWNVTMQAIGAWFIVAPIISIVLFYTLFPLLRVFGEKLTKKVN